MFEGKIVRDKNTGGILYAPIPPNPLLATEKDYEDYNKAMTYILENGVEEEPTSDINAVIVDGWNLFGYDGPNNNPSNPKIKLVASKYLNHDWEIYVDFYAAHDSRFKIYKDGKELDSQPRLSQCMRLADDCEEYE